MTKTKRGNTNNGGCRGIMKTIFLQLLGLSIVDAAGTAAVVASTSNILTTTSSGSRSSSPSQHRVLKDDSHDHDDLDQILKWSGIFKFSPGTIYNLTVKIPLEEDSDPHAGHNHRQLVRGRALQQDDDHSGHDHDHTGHDHSAHDDADDEEQEEANTAHGECHCDGSVIHCSNSHAEQHCECHDHDGVVELHCKAIDDSCHCDGNELHCSAGEDVASDLCQCNNGAVQCIGDDGDGASDHASHDDDHSSHDHSSHATATTTDTHFLLALVPVTNTWQEGIDEAIGILEGMDGTPVHNVQDGDAIVATTQHAYELSFDDLESTSTLSFVNLTQENYVLFLPTVPSQVSDSDVHFLVDENGTKVWAETARYSEPDPRDAEKPWGLVIGATLLVNLVTLTGVIFLVPMLSTAFKNRTVGQAWIDLWSSTDIHLIGGRTQKLFDICITAFACGALLATTVFLIVPEAIILVNDDGEDGGGDSHEGHDHRMLQEDDPHAGHDHGNKNWVFGASVLAGFLFPMVLASFFPHHHLEKEHKQSDAMAHETVELNVEGKSTTGGSLHPSIDNTNSNSNNNDHCTTADTPDGQVVDSEKKDDEQAIDTARQVDEHVIGAAKQVGEQVVKPAKEINKRLVCGIIVGDSLHNFADGVFVGAAFLLCGESLGWTVLAGTIYHELAQEVSDFFVLTTHAHLPPIKALILNFLSGLSVTLGGIIVLAMDVSNYALGVILSLSAGVYINVAAKECMPVVERLAVTLGDRLLSFLAFAIGAIPIGLVLLNHQHCEA